ncbi:sugar phosphate isomerase/epimerase family protein [Paenibacillus sp. GXUN7292]|uniref:sugar phosphate isomerase/epimerase family protein n=1 Tax=Paenibacillus sp. GXUN7292 TaxID=3422499 RepID=UPI003D7F092A
MKIGVIHSLQLDSQQNQFNNVKSYDLDVCQLLCGGDKLPATQEMADRIIQESREAEIRVCAVWAGLPGVGSWNFTEGPVTLGLVPAELREERVQALKQWADLAAWIGAPAIITHCGFIPENLTDPEFTPIVDAIREVAQYCAQLGIEFWFETGQETPITLLRTIERVGTSNLGINLDPANLIMYGKGNPIDALDVFGRYVRNVHVKDGFYPTNGDKLGDEVRVGEGKVDFPQFLNKLKQLGFDGEFIIEREISGPEQHADIIQTIQYLQKWW